MAEKQPQEVLASKEELLSYIERLERLEEDMKAIKADTKETYSELKSAGFDTKTVKKILKLRQMDKDEIEESEEMLKLYRKVLGL